MSVDVEQRPCAAGCKRPGSDQLRAASHGAYCDRCYGRYANALTLAADLVEHVTSHITFAAVVEEPVDRSRDGSPTPFNLQAFHDANETYRRLVYWAGVWAENLGIKPPASTGRVWRDRRGHGVGLKAGAPAAEAGRNVSRVAKWLLNHIDEIMAEPSDDLEYWGEDLADIYRINARWPREMKPRYSDAECPDEDCRGRIAVYPPTAYLEDERIVCERCGRWFEPKDYDFLVGVFKQRTLELKQAEKTARHLMKKYSIGQ